MSGYTRQSAADIIPTATVRSAPVNAEFNTLRDAFTFDTGGTTGHKHDGTSDEGSYVPLISDIDAKNQVVVDAVNDRLSFFIEVATVSTEQLRIEDGVVYPVTTSDIDLGSASKKFKDIHSDGAATFGGATIGTNGYTVIADNSYSVSSGDLTFDVAGDVIFDADNADIFLKDAGTTYGVLVNTGGNLQLKSGTVAALTFTGANADFAGTLDVTGVATLDSNATVGGTLGVTGNTTVGGTLGVTSNTTVGGTLGVTGATTLSSTLNVTGNTVIGGDLTVNGTTTTLNTTNAVVSDTLIELGNGTAGAPVNDSGLVIERGVLDNAFIGFDESADKFVLGTGTFTGASTGNLTITPGDLSVNDIEAGGTFTLNGYQIESIKDEDDFVSDSATALATQQSIKQYVNDVAGTANNVIGLTSTADELNELDASAASPASVTIVDGDGLLLIDTSAVETKQILASDIPTYVGTKNLSNLADASVARTNLGVAIGTDVQAYDAQLADVAGLSPTIAHGIVGDGSNFISTASSTAAIQLPSGTTAQRPTAANGMLRYNSDDSTVEAYNGGWFAVGGQLPQTATTTTTSQTAIATYAVADYLGMELTVIATDTVATERTITKLLVTHDGTTAVATEYGTVNTATALATYDVDINTGNIRLLATAASTNNTNYIVRAGLFDA